MKYCSKCGKEIMDEAIVCPGCGCAVAGNPATQFSHQKSPWQSETPTLANCAVAFAILMPFVGIILGIIGTLKYQDEALKNRCVRAIIGGAFMFAGLLLLLIFTGAFTDSYYYY